MKKLLLLSLCFLLYSLQIFAQTRTVTGTIIAGDDGQPMPGVGVNVKGTNIGTATGADGKYTINVPSTATTLVFSFVGYATLEKPISGNVVNATLQVSSTQLTEVVVTANGYTREKKSLGFAQTTVKNEEVNKSAAISLFGGLEGKVAGVNISGTSGSPGGSTKVIIRGFSSIGGSNAPLYVVDGVPIDNSRPGSNQNYDFGNNANDIDPNTIDNISILKGAASTALYGSRGSNGVILITTKKGKSGKPVVDFSTSVTFTNAAITYKPQDQFGQGWDGTFILSENGDWGPRFDGQMRPWGAVVNNSQLLKPYSFIPNNVANTFDTGLELNNNISLSGGNETSTYAMSYGNIYSDGILPSDRDAFKRNNFSLKGSTTNKLFTAEAQVNYVGRNTNFVTTGQGDSGVGSSFYEDVLQIPTDIPIKDLRDYKNLYFNVDNYFTPYAENPYYDLYENGSTFKSDRVYGNVNLTFNVNSWLKIQAQQGLDISNSGDKIWHNVNAPAPGSWDAGANVEGQSRAADVGNVIEEAYKNFEYDTKLNALFKTTINSHLDLDGFVGANYNDRGTRVVSTAVQGLSIPGFYNLSNSSNDPVSAEAETHRRLLGFYAQATLGYNKYLYLTVIGRNDISSTLPAGNNSYFYPGVSLAYDITEAFDTKSSTFTFAKLRASYGQAGSDTGPYNVFNTLSGTNVPLGFGSIQFPINGVAGYSISNALNSNSLKPERTNELELGGEFRFFNNRVGFDLTYYNRIKNDQILAVPIAPSSGYTSELLNFGKVRNRGIELAFDATPVKTKKISWTLNYTFTRNRNLVLELPAGLDKVVLNSAYDAQLVARVGQPLGVFEAPVPVYDPQGHIVVNNQGFPIASTTNGSYGTSQQDFQMGLSNSITVSNFTLSFNFDYRQGGKFYSGTADLLNFVGADVKTLYNDRRPFIVPNSVQAVAGPGGTTTYVENTTQITEANVDDYNYPTSNKAQAYNARILDRTFVKLREATLSYNLPKKIATKLAAQKATIGVFGRNLYTWLPASNQTIDPEVSNQGIDLASEFGEFRTSPPLRYFGASLKVTF